MYHHSASICQDLLSDEAVIENTQRDDILMEQRMRFFMSITQSDPDGFLGLDWVHSQKEKLKLIMNYNHTDYDDYPDGNDCFWTSRK